MKCAFNTRGAARSLSTRVAQQARHPVIQPAWVGTVKNHPIQDCSSVNMGDTDAPSSQNLLHSLKDQFKEQGMVHLRNTGLAEDLPAMRKWALAIMDGEYDYVGGANLRGNIEGEANVYDTGAPGDAHIHYHHEMAYLETTVSSLGLFCGAAMKSGGNTFLSDNIAATEHIMKTDLGRRLKKHGVTYIRCLTDRENSDSLGVYNHWQDSFQVDTQEQAEQKAAERGLSIEWGDRRYMKTKYSAAAFEYYPPLECNLLFSSVADDAVWFDAWPGMSHLPPMEEFGATSQNDRPLKMVLGDGSEFSREDLQTYIDAYDENSIEVEWQKDDLVIFCNYRYAHGRPAYTVPEGESRELYVTMGPPLKRHGEVANAPY